MHKSEEYLNDDLYLIPNGKAGFAIERGEDNDANLVSVFSYGGVGAGHSLVQSAVDQGANRLDCYDIHGQLPRLYGAHGFKPVARVKFDRKYAAPDWPYARMGEPDVVTMSVTSHAPETVPYTDYDTALEMAQNAAKNR